jgi:hypothetical protein
MTAFGNSVLRDWFDGGLFGCWCFGRGVATLGRRFGKTEGRVVDCAA